MLKELVFSKNVVEFTAVANEYCHFLENVSSNEKAEFIDKSIKLLSLMYYKALSLPNAELVNEEPNETFVTEFDWHFIRNGIQSLLDEDDIYFEMYDENLQELSEPESNTISEAMADIYQNVKDYLEIYKLGNEELSNDAIVNITETFNEYWGFELVKSLKTLHILRKHTSDNLSEQPKNKPLSDKKNWFISQAQDEYRDRE
ncbi:MAG TPA: DUF5063 domain-containing protein [Bacteroidales bacterium]|nr:DUF5063 domain-containing protein [Bacteroidales bacterium]